MEFLILAACVLAGPTVYKLIRPILVVIGVLFFGKRKAF
jgi:hypothetical protein